MNYGERIKLASTEKLEEWLDATNTWLYWDESILGKKPFLYDYMVEYPQKATLKKRLRYLFAAICPFSKHAFLDPKRKAIKKELSRRRTEQGNLFI